MSLVALLQREVVIEVGLSVLKLALRIFSEGVALGAAAGVSFGILQILKG